MSEEYRRQSDERIDKILDSVNSLHTKMEVLSQKIDGEIKTELGNHSQTLYDQTNGLCKIVSIDHERLGLISKLMWGVGGAIIVLIVNSFGKIILK